MQSTMQFKQHAGVVSAGGQEVGHIERVVVDPQTKAVTHIVVRTGFLLTQDDKVVPIDMVADATPDQITLHPDAGDLYTLPPFEEKHYVQAADESGGPTPASGMAPSVYGLTPISTPAASSGPRVITQVEQNIPEGTVALKEGAKVITAEGKTVGNVERVFADADANRATHLLISHGLLLKERKLIPITWVNLVGEDEVHLSVDHGVLDRLSAFQN